MCLCSPVQPLTCTFGSVASDQKQLYHFMSFMKDRGAVSVLQSCIELSRFPHGLACTCGGTVPLSVCLSVCPLVCVVCVCVCVCVCACVCVSHVCVCVCVSEGLQDQMTGSELSNEQALALLKEVSRQSSSSGTEECAVCTLSVHTVAGMEEEAPAKRHFGPCGLARR